MKVLSASETLCVSGAGPVRDLDELYQAAKEFAREFWRGLKDGAGLEESEEPEKPASPAQS
ncbi:hypothetical protein [Pseudoxanthomonas suwonensis]|uniref:hypothetical protein n=1 Tax=Pseudoxanthomonas suwonensis TaxID=314722 RepID=UPI00048FBD32|nr:hypothetical protein [Pseudoxanthomonas suwonensis]